MKFLNFVKKHKIGLIVIGVCLTLIILLFFAVKNTFFAKISDSKYGNRLDGIESYPITDSLVTDIKNGLSENEIINSVSYDLEGRIINFIVEVKPETDIAKAKEAVLKILEYFNDEYKAFYDIQVFLTCEDKENTIYPVMGYKHKTSSSFKWTVELGDKNEG